MLNELPTCVILHDFRELYVLRLCDKEEGGVGNVFVYCRLGPTLRIVYVTLNTINREVCYEESPGRSKLRLESNERGRSYR